MATHADHHLTARDVMRRQVVTVDPEMTVADLMQRFLESRITGAPVVGDDGKVLGVISQTDLLRYHRRAGPPVAPAVSSYFESANGDGFVERLQTGAPRTTRVRELMTPVTFMIEDTTPVREAARLMVRRHVHRLIVTRRGKLAGIITSMDVMRALIRRTPP
jgi:CBS domain-containing protein